MLAVLGRSMHQRGALRGPQVVTTVMSNIGLEAALAPHGVEVSRVQVGDRYVVARMRELDLNLGGEQSGHTILRDIATTGDGLVTALSMLGVMAREERSLSELGAEMRAFPQALISFEVAAKPPLEILTRTSEAIADVERTLGSRGRVLVRYSGTQRMARVMVEGENQADVDRWASELSEVMAQEIETTHDH